MILCKVGFMIFIYYETIIYTPIILLLMIQNKLAIMAIPVLAAILIGGSIAPVAYADHQNDAECERLFQLAVDAINDGSNPGKIKGLITAFNNGCLSLALGAECEAVFFGVLAALDRGNIDLANHLFFDVLLDTLDC